MAQLTCQRLCVGYDGQSVLQDLTFELLAGDYLCIVGENGSGKSTLIQLFYLSPRGQIRHTFTITFTEKRKFALFVDGCGSQTTRETQPTPRHFPLW